VPIEGEIHVAVRWNGSEIERADVRSTRPFVAPRLLAGKAVDEACALVPLLFSICGRSQAIAAAVACEAAMGVSAEPTVAGARALLVAGEAMQEYLFRALIDWPRLRGEPPSPEGVARARRRVGDALAPLEAAARLNARRNEPARLAQATASIRQIAAEASAAVLGESPGDWLERTANEGVARWAEARETVAARLVADALEADARFGASDVSLLPATDPALVARELAREMDADAGFERAPRWDGEPAETGALARAAREPAVAALRARYGGSVAVRLVARLVELAALATRGLGVNHGWIAVAPGSGVGWVETARGLLVHRARVESGQVAGYRIVAPTEWNFHPDGALARGLRGARFADEGAAERGVRLLVQALDPCVAARIEVANA
jgi:hypothetical protein